MVLSSVFACVNILNPRELIGDLHVLDHPEIIDQVFKKFHGGIMSNIA